MAYGPIVTTIEELEKLYYTDAGIKFLSVDDLKSEFVTKTNAPVTTSTAGVYNAIYGAQAWVNLNLEANVFGVLPKVPWTRSGWRVITGRASSTVTGGVAEGGNLPDTIKPTFAAVTTKPKVIAHTFEITEVQDTLVDAGDDAYPNMEQLRTYMALEHAEHINRMLMTQNGAPAGYNMESVDRVVGSYAEKTNCKESDQSTSYSADDLDIYGIDRDAGASWADAYVDYSSSGVRPLTDDIIVSVMKGVLTNGGNPTFWLTGLDTDATIKGMYGTQVQYTNPLGQTQIQPSVNGIQTPSGIGVGINVATLYGKPLILSKNTVADAGGISRLYLLDTSNPEGNDIPRLCIKVAKPTQYFEAGMRQNNPFSVNRFNTVGMYRTMAELICTFFGAQGKARDLC